MGWVIGLVVLVLVIVGAIVGTMYNGLVRARNGYQKAFGQIDVQLVRRHDLIPNLVETAKGYIRHERETLEAVVAARGAAVSAQAAATAAPGAPGAMRQLSGAENGLTQSLGKLFALAEAYPDLKANQTMLQLSEELTTTENRVAFARQAYNDAVMSYNNRRGVFPTNLLAAIFNFPAAGLFELDDPQQRAAPQVQF
jgi:LemA protein